MNLNVNFLAQKSIKIMQITSLKLKKQARAWLYCYIFVQSCKKASQVKLMAKSRQHFTVGPVSKLDAQFQRCVNRFVPTVHVSLLEAFYTAISNL